MNLFKKMFTARQSGVAHPDRYGSGGYGFSAPIAGVQVNEFTAFRYSAVWRAVNVISQHVAGLPYMVYRKDGDKLIAVKDHPLLKVLNFRPNDEMTAYTFSETQVQHAMTWGSGYAEIERTRSGRVANLWLLTPDRVHVDRDSRGRIVYEINSSSTGQTVTLGARNIFHLKGPGFDGLTAYSLVRLASESISLGLALQKYGASFFGNGSHPAGVLESDGPLSEKARQNIIKSWEAMHKGPFRANKTALLEEGLKFKQTGVDPEKAQALETRDFEITEASRWFGVPPHKLGKLSDATFSNIEQQNTEFAQEALVPWAERIEQEGNIKLFEDEDIGQLIIKKDLRQLLRGDAKSRAEANKIKADHGVININEWRADEGMNDIGPNGDLRLVPMNMVSVDKANANGGTGQKKEGKNNDSES